ncbi:GAF domain-containing protein [Ferrimicrobium sp.]|uniref:GAF domain-containing sensor histidine kinase n=1 Tax=Ferrimicrobium sp. TaxID=2926050 RepID=UPI002618AD30|nr:GAF domain-containing protein [Ferrimicrobium sp.]
MGTNLVGVDRLVSEPRLKDIFAALIDVVSKLDMDETLSLLAEHARSLTRARYAAIGVLDPEQPDRLLDFVTSGISSHDRVRIGDLPSGGGLLGAVIDTSSPVISDSIALDPRAAGFPPNHPVMNHFLGVPISTGDRVFGNIYVTDRLDDEPFDQIDIAILETLATGASAVIGNLLLRQELARAQVEDDRARIARDLHDDIVQRLFAVGLQLQAALPSLEGSAGFPFVRQAIEDLDAAIAEIRTTIFELESPQEGSSRSEILDLVSRLCTIADLKYHVVFSGPIDTLVNNSQQALLLTVLRELITNVIKHAHAHELRTEIQVSEVLTLIVTDDGVGISDHPRLGHGIKNLRAKAATHGGTFSIDASPLGGSRATFSIPLD